MEVLSSRVLVRPSSFDEGVRWYRDVLGLRVYREYGIGGRVTGAVFFLGGGFLELVSGSSPAPTGGLTLWLQVPDVDAEHARLVAAGATITREPKTEPWGLREMWVADPDANNLVVVEVPETHPIRRRVD
jgi:predicted enzyme related to lactoylglutathione lyase